MSRTDYLERIDRVVDHIQRHPADDLSLERLAALAHFSAFHFHRVFRTHVGEPLNAFVTRTRLARALTLMRAGPGKSMTSIAHECGFTSVSNFSRVFRQAYGVAPSKADLRELVAENAAAYARVASAEPAAPAATETSWSPADVRIVRREQWMLASVRVTGGYLDPPSLVAGYLRLEAWARGAGIDPARSRLIGMSLDDPELVPLARCRYDFCRTVAQRGTAVRGIRWTSLPRARWAVLHCVGGIDTVSRAWTYLFRDWLPASGWQPAALPAIEIFNRRPEEIGWDRFDVSCCLPLEPLDP